MSGMDEPRATAQEDTLAKQHQNSLIAESCSAIITQAAQQPFKNYGDAINKLNAYHVRACTSSRESKQSCAPGVWRLPACRCAAAHVLYETASSSHP